MDMHESLESGSSIEEEVQQSDILLGLFSPEKTQTQMETR
jgi:hypothetical protein